jgi:hypothetical protein
MPSITTPQGRKAYVPGVYSGFDVVSDLPGALPDFQVPVVVGEAEEGYPFDVRGSQEAHENLSPWTLRGTSSGTRTFFGSDSDMAVGFGYSKKHGLPQAYCVAINSLTRAKVIATSTGPINQMTVMSQKYGAPGGWNKVRFASGVFEVTPVRNYSRLTANTLITSTRIYVRDNSWIQVDTDVIVGSNAVAAITRTVTAVGTDLDAAGQVLYWVEFDSAIGTALGTAGYALVLEYDETGKETSPTFIAGQGQLLLDWLQNESEFLNGTKHAAFTGALPIAIATATPLKDITTWGTVTAGTTPSATSTNHTDFIALLDSSETDLFALERQSIHQAFLILDGSSTVHGSWRDWAIAKRGEGYAVSVITGARWGDIVVGAGDDTDPLFRAATLNSQDVACCAGGLDRLDAYLSFAPAVFGRRIERGIPHNLTNDDLLYSEIEVQWDERNAGELTALHRGGVLVYRLSNQNSIRYRISQGLATLQQNSNSWNEVTDDTPLLMQRDLADFIDRILKLDLDERQVGADRVTADTVAAVVVRRAQQSLLRRGLIEEFKITSITLNESGTGFDVAWSVRLPVTTDFITMTTTILIGEA